MKGATAALLAISLGLTASCGDSGSKRNDVSECGPSWKVLFESSVNLGHVGFGTCNSDLVWSNDRLYFTYTSHLESPARQSLATLFTAEDATHHVGSTTYIEPPNAPVARWWIEGNQLTYIGDDGNLYGVPLDGSAQPKLLTSIPPFDQLRRSTFALDAEALYWTATDLENAGGPTANWGLWRASRATGECVQLAALPANTSIMEDRLIIAPERILIANGLAGHDNSVLYAVPKTGGDAQVLSKLTSATIIGVAQDGSALWQDRFAGRDDGNKLLRSDGSSGAQVQVWPDKPSETFATKAWSDGNGGWYVTAQTYDEDSYYLQAISIWRLDSSGQATRLTCNLPSESYTVSGVLSPSALYLLQSDTEITRQSIVSIARQP